MDHHEMDGSGMDRARSGASASGDHGASLTLAPSWLRQWVRATEDDARRDDLASRIGRLAEPFGQGQAGATLRGHGLGHALHPMLTDLPLGCFLSANLLDVVGGRSSRGAARRLIGIGLLAVPATMATGLADYTTIDDQPTRRVGAVHAAGNMAVGGLYLMSWLARRRGHHLRGRLLAAAGGTVAVGTGYLGGHLSFARQVGTGARGLDEAGTGRQTGDDDDQRTAGPGGHRDPVSSRSPATEPRP